MLCLHLQAPFGTFRTFTAGSFRSTSGFITPTAAYGLLLNVAGIEMREDTGKEMTTIRAGLPKVRIALGALKSPGLHNIFQQLHNYPVGETGKGHAPNTKGNKYNVAPVGRHFLADIEAYVCVKGDQEFEVEILEGLHGRRPRKYGLPFLGDNNFMIDRLELVTKLDPAYWFVKIESGDQGRSSENVTRLTLFIDRKDFSKTRSGLFASIKIPTSEIPNESWCEIGY